MDYSKLSLYRKCPQSFKWTYLDSRIPKTPPNYYYAFQGKVIQKLFELWYNEEWYRKGKECREYTYNRAAGIFEDVLKETYINWQDKIVKKNKKELYEEFLNLIPKAIDTIKANKLMGKVAKSEYKIKANLDNYTVLTSRLDFIIWNDTGVQILDGKATSNKAEYLKDPTQLYFYALIYQLKYGKYPEKIGYWFWRTGEIIYCDFDDEKIDTLKKEIQETLYKIYKEQFQANPSYKNCMFCNYKDECLDRSKSIAVEQDKKIEKVTEQDLLDF